MKRVKKKSVTLETVANLVTEAHEGLARSIAEGFRGVDKRFEDMDRRFESVDKRFESVDKRFDGIEQQIQGLANRSDDLALNRATRDELTVLDKRVARIETKLGLDFKPRQHSA